MTKHTHNQLDAPNVMSFEQQFVDYDYFQKYVHICVVK